MTAKTHKPRILVAGLGNELLMDDGVGVHAIHALRNTPTLRKQRNIVIADVGVAILDALHLLAWADYILAIDAMNAGGAPGTIYLAQDSDIERGNAHNGLHELTLVSGLRLLTEHRNPVITILGVEPKTIAYGMDLTPPVAAALPQVRQHAQAIIERWCATGREAAAK
jgi:hydrogenase maturation protease